MKLRMTLLFLFVLVSFAGLIVAEEQPATPKPPTTAEIMKNLADFMPCVEGKKAQGLNGGNIAIRIEGNAGGEWVQQYLDRMSEPDAMALWISDSVIMYPYGSQSRGNFIVMGGGGEQPEDDNTLKVRLPDGKTADALKMGKLSKTGVAFAAVVLPQEYQVKRLKFEKTPIAVGDKVLVIGRRASEWKFAPFYLSGEINGELPNDANHPFFSVSLPQDQLQKECLGAVVVDYLGNFLGVVARISAKTHSMVVARPDYFAEAVKTALEAPDQLEPFEQAPRMPAMPGVVIPGVPADPDEQPVKRPFLGVGVAAVTEEKAKELGFEEPMGLLVERVGEGSPAEKAGLKVGDVILEAGGLILDSPEQLKELIDRHEPGAELEFVIFRDGAQSILKVTIGEN